MLSSANLPPERAWFICAAAFCLIQFSSASASTEGDSPVSESPTKTTQAPQVLLSPSDIETTVKAFVEGHCLDSGVILDAIGSDRLRQSAAADGEANTEKWALCLLSLGDYAGCLDAVDIYGTRILHAPSSRVLLYGAVAATRLKAYPEAVRLASMCINWPEREALLTTNESLLQKYQPEIIYALVYRGIAYLEMDQTTEAEADFQSVLTKTHEPELRKALAQRIQQCRQRSRDLKADGAARFDLNAFWIRAASSPSRVVRTHAMGQIAHLTEASVYGVLLEHLSDPSYEVRSAAACALGERGDKRAIASIRPLLRDPIKDVRESAAISLRQLGENVSATQ